MKDIYLTLSSIKYSGKSIGNDIRIEIEAIGEIYQKNFEINRGSTRNINKKIGVFRIDQSSFSLPVLVRIIERDKVLNDVGVSEVKFKVNLKESRIQKKSVLVKAKERRWPFVRPEATFNVHFDIQVMEVMHYVEEQEDGFLWVEIDGYEKVQALPAFLKVRLDRHEEGRDYFTIMEGWRQGETGSVTTKDNGESYVLPGNPYTRPIRMTYSRSKKRLKVKGKSYKTVEHPGEPWKNGLYDIEIADYPHKGGVRYVKEAPKAKVWFHIGHEHEQGKDEEKYIHTGEATLGCITLTELKRWNEIYEVFIRARLGDSKSIGVLEVID